MGKALASEKNETPAYCGGRSCLSSSPRRWRCAAGFPGLAPQRGDSDFAERPLWVPVCANIRRDYPSPRSVAAYSPLADPAAKEKGLSRHILTRCACSGIPRSPCPRRRDPRVAGRATEREVTGKRAYGKNCAPLLIRGLCLCRQRQGFLFGLLTQSVVLRSSRFEANAIGSAMQQNNLQKMQIFPLLRQFLKGNI